MVTVLKYNKISTEIYIYIKVFPYGTVSHLTVSTDDVLNTTSNVTYFPNSEKSFKNNLRLKYNKYMSLNNKILGLKYPLGFSISNTRHIMDLVNEWFPDGKCWNIDTSFCYIESIQS